MCRAATVALALCLALGPAQARTLDQVPAYLKKEGNFVSYPAIAVGGLGLAVGALVALPAALVTAPIGFLAGDTLGYAMLPSSVVGAAGAEAGYHVGGAIPWVVKNGFYDAPMTGIAKIKGEAPSGLVAQVDPAPDVAPTDLQYLASTPTDARIPVEVSQRYSAALPPPKEPTSLMLKRQLSPFKPPEWRAPVARSAAPAAAGAAAAKAAAPVTATQPAPAARAASGEGIRPAPAAQPSTAPAPAYADDVPAIDVERPTLRKKKRKFSDRFGF